MICNAVSMDNAAREVRVVYLVKRAYHLAQMRKESQFDLPTPRVLREWDGHTCQGAARKESVWQKIVRCAEQNQVDPIYLVKAAFWRCIESQPPLPIHVLRPDVIVQARSYEREWREALGRKKEFWKSEMMMRYHSLRKYDPAMSEADLNKWVICASELSLEPIIRYCLAVTAGLASAAEMYFQHAISQYIAEPDGYDAVLGPLIPEELRIAGRERLKHIMDQLGE